MNRVVITGMGAVTPIGKTVEESWEALKKGENGIDKITHFDISEQKCKMGAEVKNFDYPDKRAARRMDRSSQFAVTAAGEALADSGIESGENVAPERFGIMAGTGSGGIMTLEEQVIKATKKESVKGVSALLVPMVISNMIGGNLAMQFKAKGSCLGIVSACSAG
ncbi:MAG: beta-ketoacyl synthase N-terminal-like domain-containing protein, partial [Eubacteriales bacterium]|nr:beta-ketoacyl synthase N-terminal-like domain-containing protein [Eubacteriales bacterium]